MIDKTTDGYAAATHDVEGMLRNLCAYALSDPEPLQRYIDLTHQQVLFEGLIAAIRRERGKALADLALMGVPLAKVAELAELETPQRVKALITGAGITVPAQRRPTKTASKDLASKTPAFNMSAATTSAPKTSASSASASSASVSSASASKVSAPTTDVATIRYPVSMPAESKPATRTARTAAPVAEIKRTAKVLPPTIAPIAKRTLTAEERRALGLPELMAPQGEAALKSKIRAKIRTRARLRSLASR